MRNIRFGLNYVPSKNWYYCWNAWDSSAIAADFDAIASLGADHVRVMVIWSWFQPNPATVSEAHLERLVQLMGLAGERNLDVLLCPLTGWLSGYVFLPPGVTGEDVFLDRAVFERSLRYLEAVLAAVKRFPGFLGFDLGNEINCLFPGLSTVQGDAWARRIVSWLRPRMEGRWLVNGVDHQPWFFDRGFSPLHLVEDYDLCTLHAWPEFTGCLRRGGLADRHSLHLSAFLVHLCRRFQRRAGVDKPIWVQEFGCSDLWGSPSEKETYLRGSVALAARAGATCFTWWASHDIGRSFAFNDLEYDLGLFTTDNTPKRLASVFRELVEEWSDYRAPTSLEDPLELPADFNPATLSVLERTDPLSHGVETLTELCFDRYLERLRVAERSTADQPMGRNGVERL